MLYINLLGTPELYLEDQLQLRFRTRKAQALLIYLAVTERSWSRDALAALFWPETDDARARKNIRDILPPLRRQLGDYLLLENDAIGLAPAKPHFCDVTTFSQVLERQLEEIETDHLVETLSLYNGEFLEGFTSARISADFELWVLRERERLHQLALMGFTSLCRRQQDADLYEAALATNHQLLKLAPWNEAAHRQQMLLLAQSGQRAAALAHFEACRQILAEELDVAPDAETMALCEQIQAGTFNQSQAPSAAPLSDSTATTTQPITSTPPAGQAMIPNNLLAPLSVFVGRQRDLTFIRERLATNTCRLLTIVGPGGMGKSSLALAAGQQILAAPATNFPDGIFWVSLADINAATLEPSEERAEQDAVMGEAILRAIADQLSTQPPIRLLSSQQLHAYLCPRRLLLILDNLEHLLAGTHALGTLLAQAPHVKILATSRARLNLRGEHLLPLDKLSLPVVTAHTTNTKRTTPAQISAEIADGAWQASEAVAMFLQRAQQLDPAFILDAETIQSVVQICQLVEGLPLGIELATSMLPLLSCRALAAELAESLDFLEADTRDLPREQRTLQAVFERSWRLLAVEEQQLLARLAVFPGSFERDAAQQIAGATLPLVKRLVDQSLVYNIGENRYLLHRTVQVFANQKLQAQPAQARALQMAYAHFYLEFLAGKEGGLLGATYGSTVEQIQTELDNIHAAWRRAVAHQMFSELGDCLTALLWFYEQQGFYLDVMDLCDHALRTLLPIYEAHPNRSGTPITLLVGRLQTLVGLWHLRVGRLPQAHALYEASWAILQHEDDPIASAYCLGFWGASLRAKDPQQSVAQLTAALQIAQASGVAWMQATLYQLLGEASLYAGDYVEAEAKTSAGHPLAQQINWARGLAVSHKIRGRIHLVHGRYRHAEDDFCRSVEIARHHHINHYYLSSMIMLGEARRLQGRFAEARSAYAQSRMLAKAYGSDVLIAPVLWEEGSLAEQCGNYEEAKAHFTESLAIGIPNGWVHVLPTLGWALIGLGELQEADGYFQKVRTDAEARGYLPISLDAQAGLAYLAERQASTNHLAGTIDHAPSAEVAATFRYVYHHPSATQQTRDRVESLAAELGVSLGHVPKPSATITRRPQ